MVALKERYANFLQSRTQANGINGFDPGEMPSWLFDFQKYLVEWALRTGRAAIFADCGLGKTAMQLAWADAVVKKTNKPVLLLTPIAVGLQTLTEAAKFGVTAARSRDGKVPSSPQVVITNYEQLPKFDPSAFAGAVCDESSAIKDFKSQRKELVVEFMRTMKYRLLCTATAAPNDYWELGTSSEALGYLGFRDMITAFFKQETQKDDLGWGRTKYRFRGHAEKPFWSWVCGWAKCIRSPADIGFDASRFVLPRLNEHEHIVQAAKLRNGMLFSLPAGDMQEQREERRNSIGERADRASELVSKPGAAVVWCDLNDEADTVESMVSDAKQVTGSMSDEEKEETLAAFAANQIRVLVTKPKIGCWGLNWQHCNNVVMFPSYSFEQYYQAVRRCWRFGQKNEVDVHLVVSEGEAGVLKGLRRKMHQAEVMYNSLRDHMNDPSTLVKADVFNQEQGVPSWLS